MKKIYQTPALHYISLENEGEILTQSFEVDAAQETEDRFTQKQEPNFWGREGIWK